MEQQQFSLSISHYTINSVLTWLMMIYPPPTPGLSSAALRRKSDCAHFFYLLFVCYSMEYLIIWRWRFPNHVNYQPQDTWNCRILAILSHDQLTYGIVPQFNYITGTRDKFHRSISTVRVPLWICDLWLAVWLTEQSQNGNFHLHW